MSIDALARVMPYDGVSGTAKLVLVLIAWHANGDDSCYPSTETLAREAGVSVRQVRRTLRELERVGVVETTSGKARRTNTYRLLVPGHQRQVTPDTSVTHGGHQRQVTPDTSVPQIDNEPTSNQHLNEKSSANTNPHAERDGSARPVEPGRWAPLTDWLAERFGRPAVVRDNGKPYAHTGKFLKAVGDAADSDPELALEIVDRWFKDQVEHGKWQYVTARNAFEMFGKWWGFTKWRPKGQGLVISF